jgi:predicted methyltransferase
MNWTKTTLWAALGVAMLAGCGRSADEQPPTVDEPAAEPTTVSPPPASSAMAMPDTDSRSAEDRARDAGRKPAEVLAFLGVQPGMQVIDVIAAGGWYSEVLSQAVGADGHVVAQNPPFILAVRDGMFETEMSARLKDNRLPNVTRLDKAFADITSADGQFDVALTALNFHDIYNRNGAEVAVGFLRAVASVLKPGGVFGIIDHAGIAGADNAALHRIELAKVLETAEAAGLEVVEQSDLLANANDDHTQMVFADEIRGSTDRFIVKLRKPD